MVLNEESQAERLKDLDEKFPERKEMDLDAPYLLELHKLQRRVKYVLFEKSSSTMLLCAQKEMLDNRNVMQ